MQYPNQPPHVYNRDAQDPLWSWRRTPVRQPARLAQYAHGGWNLVWVGPRVDQGDADEDELLSRADAQTSGDLLIAGDVPGYPVVRELTPTRADGVSILVR